MDERLRTHAAALGDVFSWADAQRYGVRPAQLAAWASTGEVMRVRRNAYVVGQVWTDSPLDVQARLRVRAVVHASNGWVASHQSALSVHNLPLHSTSLGVIDVVADVSRMRESARVRRHPRADNPHQVSVGGLSSVPIPWAIGQVALREGVIPALVALDRALHEERTCLEDVRRAGHALAVGGEDARPVERLLALADARCESVGETLTRVMLLDLGFRPTSQFVITRRNGRFVARVDFLLENGVVVEFDGAIKYAGEDKDEVLAAQDAREKAIRELGYGVARLTWDDLDRPAIVLAKIRAALMEMAAAS